VTIEIPRVDCWMIVQRGRYKRSIRGFIEVCDGQFVIDRNADPEMLRMIVKMEMMLLKKKMLLLKMM